MKRSENIRPLTPKGIQMIESGEMDYFDPECYSNFNTVALEGYFEEKNRKESFVRSHFKWWKLALMIIIVGIPFTFITQFIALKLGFILSSVFYVTYILGTALKWKPTEVNIISSSTNLVDQTVVGFVYVFPAIALLAGTNQYAKGQGDYFINVDPIYDYGFLGLVIIISLFSALASLFYFVLMRRFWIVEDPLPTPGFESLVKLMDLSNSISRGLRDKARSALKKMTIAGIMMFVFAFLRDFHIFKTINYGKVSMLDKLSLTAGVEKWYLFGNLMTPMESARYTHVSYTLSGMAFSIGWFMRAKISFMLFLGSVFIWFFVVPITVSMHMHYFWPITGEEFDVFFLNHFFNLDLEGTVYFGISTTSAFGAFEIAKNLAIGCIIGAGFTAVLKMFPVLKKMRTGRRVSNKQDPGWVPFKGWHEWPRGHIPIVAITSFLSIFIMLMLIGGFHPVSSFIVSAFLTFGSIILYLITVKIAGESGLGPTIAILTISILTLFGLLSLLEPIVISQDEVILLTLLGTVAFGAAWVVPLTIFWDFKTGHYIGTRPMHLIKGQSVAMLVGIPFSVVIAALFSKQLIAGNSGFIALQANAFATLITALAAGSVYNRLIIGGVIIGIIVELVTGKGTVFGLGMFFPLGYPLMFLTGGVAREVWERRIDKKMTEEDKTSGKRSMKLLDSYMVMTGIFVGEALIGLVLSIYFLLGGA